MAKSLASKRAAPKRSERTSIPATARMEAERYSKLAAPPGEAASDLDTIVREHFGNEEEVEIGKRAHAIWEAQRRPSSLELEHWLRARSEHPKTN